MDFGTAICQSEDGDIMPIMTQIFVFDVVNWFLIDN